MIVNFWLLPIALLLLWFPRQWLRFGRKVIPLPARRAKTDKDLRDASDVSLHLRDELKKPRNWVDFLRAAAGGIAICVVCFEVTPGAPKGTANLIFVIQCVLLMVAVAIQTVRFQQRLTLIAPIFFILGLSFGLLGWKAAFFACVTVWVLNLLIPSVGVFLFVFAGLELGFARFLDRGASMKTVLLAAALAFAPVVLSAMTNRRLVKLSKKTKSKAVEV